MDESIYRTSAGMAWLKYRLGSQQVHDGRVTVNALHVSHARIYERAVRGDFLLSGHIGNDLGGLGVEYTNYEICVKVHASRDIVIFRFAIITWYVLLDQRMSNLYPSEPLGWIYCLGIYA